MTNFTAVELFTPSNMTYLPIEYVESERGNGVKCISENMLLRQIQDITAHCTSAKKKKAKPHLNTTEPPK